MADKPEVLATPEEKLSQAKELFGRGNRNYYTKQYSEAADDFSACCSLYSELKGQLAEELGMPYLMYAKALVALGTEENKLLAPEEDEEEEDEGEDEVEDDGTEDGNEAEGDAEAEGEEAKADGEAEAEGEEAKADEEAEAADDVKDEKMTENGEKSDKTNGHAEEEKPSSTEEAGEPHAGPSTSSGAGAEKDDVEVDDDKGGSNLEVAWEVLELAVKIFEEQGEKAYESLSEATAILADISFENSHFEVSVNDFNKALAIMAKMTEPSNRVMAEIHYKIGLAHLMINSYEDSVMSLKKAVNILDEEIKVDKKKEQSDEVKANIQDLEETKQEILVKITEVEEAKTTSIEQIKNELSKIIGIPNPESGESSKEEATNGSTAATTKSPSSAEKKATDISHLIKRKKPDTHSAEVEGSPAKKTHVEGEKNGTSS